MDFDTCFLQEAKGGSCIVEENLSHHCSISNYSLLFGRGKIVPLSSLYRFPVILEGETFFSVFIVIIWFCH